MATDVNVPTLGESITEATVSQWLKQPGDAVAADEPIASLGWPGMNMGFSASPALIEQAKVGDRVEFDLVVTGSAGEVKAIRPQ